MKGNFPNLYSAISVFVKERFVILVFVYRFLYRKVLHKLNFGIKIQLNDFTISLVTGI